MMRQGEWGWRREQDPMGETTANPLPVGTTVHERYHILAVVGRGGLGTVYQVRDVLFGKNNVFALKELSDQSLGARKQFELESQWLQSLNHNHIPKVREHFEWDRRLYLVMDFVDGENLEQKLARQGGRPLVEQQVVQWILPICDALHYMHTRTPPILHRDVKPANIIVTPGGHPVLVDLGIAKEHLPGAGMTATFVRKAGTEGYAPPEQYSAAGQTGPWSDVYGLGATLYQLLTGGLPPTAVERVALDARLLHPVSVNPAVSQRTDLAIFRALALRPVERFQTMQAFAQALMGIPFAAQSPSPAIRPQLPELPPVVPSALAAPPTNPTRPAVPSPLPPIWSESSARLPPPPSASAPRTPSFATPNDARPWSDPGSSRPATTGQLSHPSLRQKGTHYESRSLPALPSVNTPSTPALEGHEAKKRRGVWPLVIGAVLTVAIVATFVAAAGVLRSVAPPDRSSAQATITGYFDALSSQDYMRAWQYVAQSRSNEASQADFINGLKADDAQFGRVLTARIVQVEEDNGGKTSAMVEVTRAGTTGVVVYSVSLTQYGGDTWLINGIATN